MTTTEAPAVPFVWDEPQGCSPRGWLMMPADAHPDIGRLYAREHLTSNRPDGRLPCAFYLDYSDSRSGRDGKHVLARAYFQRIGPGGGSVDLACDWFASVDDAKSAMRSAVEKYLSEV